MYVITTKNVELIDKHYSTVDDAVKSIWEIYSKSDIESENIQVKKYSRLSLYLKRMQNKLKKFILRILNGKIK